MVDEFRPALTRFAQRQGASDPEAVVNTALFDAVRNLHNFRGDDRRAFRSYLYQIARRRIADEFRRRHRQPKTVGELNPESSELVDIGASSFDDRVVDQQMIDQFLGRLTEEQREVLEMRVLTGLSIRETADRTGRSEMAVKAMQRRALLSLRTIVLTAAVLLVAFFGIRAMLGAGDGGTVVVENGPANGSDGGGGDEQGFSSGVGDAAESPAPLVVEAGPEAEVDGEGVIAEEPPSSTEPPEAAEAGDGEGAAGADGGDEQPEEQEPAQERPAPTTTPSTAPTTTVAARPTPTTPCNIFTDGSPAVGELAFVDYDFSGHYTFLKGTSVALVGSGDGDPILSGYGGRSKVADGSRFPFVIDENMIVDGKLEVSSRLANGELTALCRNSGPRLKQPCVVIHDGTPAAGEVAQVVYKVVLGFDLFKDEPTHIVGGDRKSAMVDKPANYEQNARHEFTIDKSMLTDDGKLEATTAFAGGQAVSTCWARGE